MEPTRNWAISLKLARAYAEAVQLNPGKPRAWLGLGSTYLNLEDEGVERMGKAHLSSAYFQALGAKSYLEEGRLNDAIAKYRQVLEAQSAPACVRSDFGFALIQSDRSADAEREFLKELGNAPRCLEARLGLARIALAHGDTAIAIAEASKVWLADHNFLSANAPMLWQGLSTEKLEGLETPLKGTQVPDGVPPGLRDALLAALARWRKNPVETVAEMSTNFLTGSVNPVLDVTAQRISQPKVAQSYSEGKYTACRESLTPALSRLTSPRLPAPR